MCTTLQWDDALVVEAQVLAARTGRSLSRLIEDALRQALAPRPRGERAEVRLPTSQGAPIADVSLDDNVALRDLMDGDEPRWRHRPGPDR
jgi:hypothetical protein